MYDFFFLKALVWEEIRLFKFGNWREMLKYEMLRQKNVVGCMVANTCKEHRGNTSLSSSRFNFSTPPPPHSQFNVTLELPIRKSSSHVSILKTLVWIWQLNQLGKKKKEIHEWNIYEVWSNVSDSCSENAVKPLDRDWLNSVAHTHNVITLLFNYVVYRGCLKGRCVELSGLSTQQRFHQ